jgi:transposase-like protein
MANTIFEKSTTPLTYWFYAIFLFTKSKNGLSASELQRQIGVTYKTAFRMLHKIRSLLIQENEKFTGIVEMDEAYVGGKNKNRHFDKKIKHTQGRSHMDKKTLFGIMERGGNVIVRDIPNTSSKHLLPIIYKNVLQNPETIIMTDEWTPYKKLDKNYKHEKVYHGKGQYSNGLCHTNSMENFWSVLKRTINGSYVGVSKKYMQVYADEVVFRYNNRNNRDIFNSVLEKI